MKRPRIKLIGTDGNVFAVLGKAKRELEKVGWSAEQISNFLDEATLGDYQHVLATCCKYFDVK